MQPVDDRETNIRKPRGAKYRDDESISASTHVRSRCTYSVNKRHLSPGIALHFPFYVRSARFMSRFMFRTECAGLSRVCVADVFVRVIPRRQCIFIIPFPIFLLSLITQVVWLMLCLQSPYVTDGDFTSRRQIVGFLPVPTCCDTLLNTVLLSKLFRRILILGLLVFRCTVCFSVFFFFCSRF